MSDLTSKAEVLETYAELFDMFDDSKEICKELCKVYDKIMGLPTIDAVPVVRCKDCKHRPIDTGGKGYGEDLSFDDDYKCPCKCEDPFYSWMPKDDWFCANGERSEEECEDENWYTELDDEKIAERSDDGET